MGTNALTVVSAVAGQQTVSIGADIYEITVPEVVTAWGYSTGRGDFNNTTDPLVISTFSGQYDTAVLGWVFQIGTERLLVTAVSGGGGSQQVTFSRGCQGTTIAAHANGVQMYLVTAPVVQAISGSIAVAMASGLTAALFTQALTDAINAHATENSTAVRTTANLVTVTNNGTSVLNCSETLAGSGNQWASATIAASTRTDGRRTHELTGLIRTNRP